MIANRKSDLGWKRNRALDKAAIALQDDFVFGFTLARDFDPARAKGPIYYVVASSQDPVKKSRLKVGQVVGRARRSHRNIEAHRRDLGRTRGKAEMDG